MGSPGSSTQQGQELAPELTAGCWVSFGRISHILRPQPRKRATRVSQGQTQGPTVLLQLESFLSPQLPLLDLLLVSPPRKQARLRPTPCVAGGSSAATKACRRATGLRYREPGQGGGKAQVNTAVLWPMWAGGAAAKELAGGLPEASGKGRVQSGTFKHVPDTDGKAGPGKKPVPLAVKQADGKNLP